MLNQSCQYSVEANALWRRRMYIVHDGIMMLFGCRDEGGGQPRVLYVNLSDALDSYRTTGAVLLKKKTDTRGLSDRHAISIYSILLGEKDSALDAS